MHLFPVWCISPRTKRELRIPLCRRRAGGPQTDQTPPRTQPPRGREKGRRGSAVPRAARGPAPAHPSGPAPPRRGEGEGGGAQAHAEGAHAGAGGERARSEAEWRKRGGRRPTASLPQTGGPGGRRKATRPERRRPRRRAGGERSEPRAGAGRREKPRHRAGAWVCRGKLRLCRFAAPAYGGGCSCAPAHRHSDL